MNRNKLFFKPFSLKSSGISGVAGEFRCHRLHRSQMEVHLGAEQSNRDDCSDQSSESDVELRTLVW
jgi:hypothetical protein